jgi:FdhD protein
MSAQNMITYYKYRSKKWDAIQAGIIQEQPVALTVNGEVWFTFLCTPVDLEALAVGFLYNETFIHSIDEIDSLRVCPQDDNIDVWLKTSPKKPANWARTSGCSGGLTSSDLLNPVIKRTRQPTITPEAIQALAWKFLDSQVLYKNVGGVHSSALSDGRELLILAEDVGRHNTLDKIAGRMILDRLSLRDPVLLTTGRISSDMVIKSARIGAFIVISRTSPTALSVALAEEAGITLVGYARRDGFNVYTHPESVRGVPPPEVQANRVASASPL